MRRRLRGGIVVAVVLLLPGLGMLGGGLVGGNGRVVIGTPG